jgi:hypothetical protein
VKLPTVSISGSGSPVNEADAPGEAGFTITRTGSTQDALEVYLLIPQRYPCHFRRNLWYSAELERGWSWKEVKDDRATDPRRWSGALQALG